MSVKSVRLGEAESYVILNGNEAVARGAIEAGVHVCSSYPGSPTSEIPGTLAELAKDFGYYMEWSTNEIVALEVAAAASFAGLRSITIMKPNGVNVASDFLMSVIMSGSRGGMVLVVGDDPGPHSSLCEEDTRNLAKTFHIPLLEPSNYQEAKDMTKWAFELSETLGSLCMVRSVTRIAHGRGGVKLGEILSTKRKAIFRDEDTFLCLNILHPIVHQRLKEAEVIFNRSPFNSYEGSEGTEKLIITTGTGLMYSREALEATGFSNEIGILKIGTSWPLPKKLILDYLHKAKEVLFVEEIDPFIETELKSLAAQEGINHIKFYGKESGHVLTPIEPGIGELDTDVVCAAIIKAFGNKLVNQAVTDSHTILNLPPAGERDLAFCPGCPHRASFWAVKSAISIDGRNGIVLGDIGCYCMAVGKTGFNTLKTLHCMGAAIGIASGLGKLSMFDFDQPVISVVGDSTFYHAVLPGLINAKFNNSNFLCIVLDNGTTAMTGHQPHPGSGYNALGQNTTPIKIEDICNSLGLPVFISDPYEIESSIELIFNLLQDAGLKVLILRRNCALLTSKKESGAQKYVVDEDKCVGNRCGCTGFCSSVYSCPASYWDQETEKAKIDEVSCHGCGVCAKLCPNNAIRKVI